MGEELLEIEQGISKAKVLLCDIKNNRYSKMINQDILRIDILLDSYIDKIIYLYNDGISHEQFINIINIKKRYRTNFTIYKRGIWEMINIEDLLIKMDEISELLNSIRKENVNDEIFELSYNYSYEIIKCRNMIKDIINSEITYNQYLLIKQARDNIDRLYKFKDYIIKLTIEE